MKGTILYSSATGNTQKLAEELFAKIKNTGDWTLHSIKDDNIDISDADVILLGGWAESGTLNKAAQKYLNTLDLSGKKLGIFMTMGSRTETEHGHFCEENLSKLLDSYDSLGVQTLQGHISPLLMNKLSQMPESAIPASVKTAMMDGVATYEEPTDAQYTEIASFFADQF